MGGQYDSVDDDDGSERLSQRHPIVLGLKILSWVISLVTILGPLHK